MEEKIPNVIQNMTNIVYLQSYSSFEDHQECQRMRIPLESFISYCIYKYCSPVIVDLKFVHTKESCGRNELKVCIEDPLEFLEASEVPWQVASCVYPVVLHGDTVITGLCAVARHISKFSSTSSSSEHEEGLLGFRKSCLQAPNEVSIWTKFCEIDIIKTVKEVLVSKEYNEVPINLVRFENHLCKPVKVHNVYKLARNIHKEKKQMTKNEVSNVSNIFADNARQVHEELTNKERAPKNRKWKSKTRKDLEIDSSIKIEDLHISHQFAEGPFLTLADLILLPSYHILVKTLGRNVFEKYLPQTRKWIDNVIKIQEIAEKVVKLLDGLQSKKLYIQNIEIPVTENVSLYKCDPKRHNPKKRLFTKEDDIENALAALHDNMALEVSNNDFDLNLKWNDIPGGANPLAGHLPDERMLRKSQQLENLTLAVLSVAKEGDLIVDFCSGSGHLGILIAHLLPKCTVILLENKEQSLLRARARVHDMNLKNVRFFQCNLDFFIGKFDIGIALHACGVASDLVLDKCLKAQAKFVLCPCCYGSLHATDRLVYPRSNKFRNLTIDQYLCIGHAADQTHEDCPLTVRGAKCMAVIDSDRARLAEEFGYKVTLSRLKPLSCTPKNNLLIGVPLSVPS